MGALFCLLYPEKYSIILVMSDEDINFSIGDEDDAAQTKSGVIKAKITPEFLMDLYDQHRDMDSGPVKDGFLATIKVFEEYLGGYLMIEDENKTLPSSE